MANWLADYVQDGGALVSLGSYVYMMLHVGPDPTYAGQAGFASSDGASAPRILVTYVE